MSMFVRDEDFEVLSGQTVRNDRKADTGNVIAMNFCTRHELLHALPCLVTKSPDRAPHEKVHGIFARRTVMR
jgi:hypothetical protein